MDIDAILDIARHSLRQDTDLFFQALDAAAWMCEQHIQNVAIIGPFASVQPRFRPGDVIELPGGLPTERLCGCTAKRSLDNPPQRIRVATLRPGHMDGVHPCNPQLEWLDERFCWCRADLAELHGMAPELFEPRGSTQTTDQPGLRAPENPQPEFRDNQTKYRPDPSSPGHRNLSLRPAGSH